MATLNVSDKQKQRVVEVLQLVQPQWPLKLSQADVVELGMAALEDKYKLNTKRIDNMLDKVYYEG